MTAQPAAQPVETLATPTSGLGWPTVTLWQREMVRFFRQRNRVIGAVATPLVFWLLLGWGLNNTFVIPMAGGDAVNVSDPPAGGTTPGAGVGYLAYFYPGTVVLILLFTAIFSTISVIEDRREGFLQAVLVAPVPRLAIVLGKVLGGASIASIQGAFFLILWPLVGGWPGMGAMVGAVAVMFLLAMGITAMSLCFAWPMDSVAGFHAVMNLALMPMWFLSGAVFPVSTAPWLMRLLMWLNPLTYGYAAFAPMLRADPTQAHAAVPWPVALGVLCGFTVAMTALAQRLVARPRKDGSA